MRNEVTISGVLVRTDSTYEVLCLRDSGSIDRIILSSEIDMDDYEGLNVTAHGHIRAKKGTDLRVEADYIHETVDIGLNYVELTGRVCKVSNVRYVTNNRLVRTVILSTGEGNYIPVVLWNSQVRTLDNIHEGDVLSLEGRLQSREFNKKVLDTIISKTTYEVTTMKIV